MSDASLLGSNSHPAYHPRAPKNTEPKTVPSGPTPHPAIITPVLYPLPDDSDPETKLEQVLGAPTPIERVKQLVRILQSSEENPENTNQTNTTLLKSLLHEVYEYIDAVEINDRVGMREELGDILLQIMFQAQLSAADPDLPFSFDEVCDRLVRRMIKRHPEVFEQSDDDETAWWFKDGWKVDISRTLWDQMEQHDKHESILDGISHSQGALPRAAQIMSRLRKASKDVLVLEAQPAGVETGEDYYADRILEVVKDAADADIDIEAALRHRLSEFEDNIRDIEKAELTEDEEDVDEFAILSEIHAGISVNDSENASDDESVDESTDTSANESSDAAAYEDEKETDPQNALEQFSIELYEEKPSEE
ncbi:nucleotide pyrophosphohydrolase [Bifidobacterium dolichotidis]|uniref:Nucleotide pyrophosphohydrolase n=1 Tax=Bifidobacterium dolichotidis TaxID=2306976 RepID=A0A430FQ33_9BIFI|nr:MazG nucleotide pyrophosphohydrolase domain-containing protein [Bifidobacterium dolichotidis]RSX54904.1 nucleotide pyrophosphohydrolase [Bifidobacterium dolichotidis]